MAALAMLLAAAGCAAQPSVALPRKATPVSAPAPAASTPSPSPSTGTRQGAVGAYLAIWPAGDRAERAGSPAKARAILAPYATVSYAQLMITGMRPFWRRHELAIGRMADHVTTAALFTGHGGQQAAIVVDCQDASHHQLARAATGQVIPGTRGPRHAKLYASLTFSHGRWLVDHITWVSNKC